VIVRSVENAKFLLSAGVVEELALDHDMGRDYSTYDLHPTGMDLAKWMIETNTFPSGTITIHSRNMIGAKNMKGLLDNYLKHKG